MAIDLTHIRERLKQPWLTQGTDTLLATFEQTIEHIQTLEQSLDRHPIVLVCEPHPETFLGYLFACIGLHTPVFLTNPQWQQTQWQQVTEQISPDLFLGNNPYSLSYPKTEYKVPNSEAIMIPTGGSAGNIKFAIHTWPTLTAAVDALCHFLRTETLHAYCTLPLYHVSGLMQAIRTLHTGGQLQLTDYRTLETEFSSKLPSEKTTTLSLVPTQLSRLIKDQRCVQRLKQFDAIFIGGAAAHSDLLNTARELELPLILSYGTTETAAMIAAMPAEVFLQNEPIAGTLLPNVEATIENKQIKIKTPSLCHGIYPNRFTPNTFLATGDEGYLNEQGKLVVLGRMDRLINTGGEKIDPQEVETALLNTGLVEGCIVVPQEDADWGHIVVAIYTPSQSFQSIEHLKAALKASIPAYQIPKKWIAVETLPLTKHGKLDRKQITEIICRFH